MVTLTCAKWNIFIPQNQYDENVLDPNWFNVTSWLPVSIWYVTKLIIFPVNMLGGKVDLEKHSLQCSICCPLCRKQHTHCWRVWMGDLCFSLRRSFVHQVPFRPLGIPLCHVLNSENRGLKALLPFFNCSEVHSVSQPLFNLFFFC